MAKIAIVDYGMANLRSVQKAFESVGQVADIVTTPLEIVGAGHLVLPGVGAFKDAIARLRETGLDQAIIDHIQDGRPFLGICLGLQLLFTRSFEDGEHAGLDVFPGDVVRFTEAPGLKIPHMGWNRLKLNRDCPLFAGLPDDPEVYFVHSYFPANAEPAITSATAEYPGPFTAAVWRDNVYATQFHPEKSQRIGLRMLANFAET